MLLVRPFSIMYVKYEIKWLLKKNKVLRQFFQQSSSYILTICFLIFKDVLYLNKIFSKQYCVVNHTDNNKILTQSLHFVGQLISPKTRDICSVCRDEIFKFRNFLVKTRNITHKATLLIFQVNYIFIVILFSSSFLVRFLCPQSKSSFQLILIKDIFYRQSQNSLSINF